MNEVILLVAVIVLFVVCGLVLMIVAKKLDIVRTFSFKGSLRGVSIDTTGDARQSTDGNALTVALEALELAKQANDRATQADERSERAEAQALKTQAEVVALRARERDLMEELIDERTRADGLAERVRELEDELHSVRAQLAAIGES